MGETALHRMKLSQELSGNAQYAGVHWTKVVRAPATPQLGLDHATSSDIGIPNMFYNKLL
jgi:hypothetical protein